MKSLKKIVLLLLVVSLTTGVAGQSITKVNPVITGEYEGAIFSSDKSLIDNLAQAEGLSYAHAILANPKLAKLTSEDSYTVFVAPNKFFDKMDEERRDAFLATSNGKMQSLVFSTFIIPGRLDSRSLMYELEKRKGEPLYLKTLSGSNLGVKMKGKNLILFDNDYQVKLIKPDYYHSKGFFHIVDGYLMSKTEK